MTSKYRNLFLSLIISFLLLTTVNIGYSQAASQTTHIVKSGDTMWKIAVRYEIGLSEIISSNSQIKNPDLIYPGQKIIIPNIDNIKSKEMEVIRLVNVERAKQGLQPLSYNWELSRVARYKSKDMANIGYFDHTSPTYGSPFTMMKNFGIRYSYAGENIAMGYRTPEDVVNGWMNSAGHRRNILSPNFTQIGVGYATNNQGVPYWTQMFIRP